MAAALWMVLALTSLVDIFFACAFEDATTMSDFCARPADGQMYSTAANTSFCTTCVLPEPPCPSSRRWYPALVRRLLLVLPRSVASGCEADHKERLIPG